MNNQAIRIMLADDDETDRMLFKEALEELKIKTIVNTVTDGIELMDYLANQDNPLPDLLFLDLNMPLKMGLECLKEIRNDDRFSDIIIAIYSTSSYKKDIEETFINGANVYIQKPNEFKKLREIVYKVVSTSSVYKEPPFNIANFMLQI